MTSETLMALPGRPGPSAKPDLRLTSTCPECGHLLRVYGRGRHRVYSELDDERSADPVMNGACRGCGHGLPGKSPR
jgi:hypothetical protein